MSHKSKGECSDVGCLIAIVLIGLSSVALARPKQLKSVEHFVIAALILWLVYSLFTRGKR